MRTLALALLAFGLLGFAGTAQAGPSCFEETAPDRTAETPPPPPPSPNT